MSGVWDAFLQPRFLLSMKNTESMLIGMVLLLSAALGVAHALITPAWANVEEPGHFEYVRFIATHAALPDPAAPDPAIRQRILDSFVWKHSEAGTAGRMANTRLGRELGLRDEQDWARLRGVLAGQPGYEAFSLTPTPEALLATGLTPIGQSQLDEPPGYYLLAALTQPLAPRASIETQLLLARLASVPLGVATVWLAYLVMVELFPQQRPVRVVVPALIALQPSFVVLTGAVNNTVAAAAAVSALLFAAVRTVRRGAGGLNLLLLGGAALACVFSKPTAYAALLVIPVALVLARRRPWPRWVVAGAAAIAMGLLIAAFEWARPAAWYMPRPGLAVPASDAPAGQYVFRLETGQAPGGLYQTAPSTVIEQVEGRTVTLGVWMRSPDGSATAPLPSIWAAPNEGRPEPLPATVAGAPLDEGWQFLAATAEIPAGTQCLAVRMLPGSGESAASAVEYDGLVLAVGEFPLAEAPIFESRGATRGQWGGAPFENLLRNGSAERGRPQVRPAVEELLPASLADTSLSINARLATLLDWEGNWPTLHNAVRWLFTTFWGRYAWTRAGLPRGLVLVLAVLTAASLAGLLRALYASFRRGTAWESRALSLLPLAAALILGAAIIRLDPFVVPSYCDRYQGRFISSGYYIIPGVVPLVGLWYMGLQSWLPRRWHRVVGAVAILFFFYLTLGMLFGAELPTFLRLYGVQVEAPLLAAPW